MIAQRILSSSIVSNTAKTSTDNAVSLVSGLDLKVFHHHIYEYKKGLRKLILTTEKSSSRAYIEKRLNKENIAYLIHEISPGKINVFFGNDICIKVVEQFNSSLNKLTPEEDFILGTLLGYSKLQQCERYLKIKNKVKT